MCNLYSITTNQAAILALFRVVNRYVGNLQPMPGVFPDYPAPVIRNTGAGRDMTLMRWGMPPPPRTGGPPVTNIRNTSSPHWRGWLKPENRCLVPANSFAEYAPETNPETRKKDVVWFALDDRRPLFCLPASGPNSRAIAARSPNRYQGLISSTAFSRRRRTPSCSPFIRRPCLRSSRPRKNERYGCALPGTRQRRCNVPCPTMG